MGITSSRAGQKRQAGGARASRTAWLTGLIIALLLVLAGAFRAFESLEGGLIDSRIRWAASLSPEPSDRIVHIDIDEEALEKIDRWPWNREDLAYAIDAMRLAGTKTILLDLLITHPQKERLRESGGRIERFSDDHALAEAIRKAGNVLVACALESRDAEEGGTAIEVRLPIPIVLDAAAGLGIVNAGFGQGDSQTIVRELPAFTDVDGTRFWQLGVRATAHYLGVPEAEIEAAGDELVLGDRRMRLRRGKFVVPWRPRTETETDERRAEARAGGRPFVEVDGEPRPWQLIHDRISITELVQVGRVLAGFERAQRRAIGVIENAPGPYDGPLNDDKIEETDSNAEFMLMDFSEGVSTARDALAAALETETDPAIRADLIERLTLAEALVAWPALRDAASNGAASDALSTLELLRERLDGKLAVVGWTAEGAIADFYPTALGGRTPGAMVHSATANGILTGHWFHRVHAIIDTLGLVALGLIGVLSGTLMRPGRGWILAVGVVVGYSIANVFWWFGVKDTILSLAPLVIVCLGAWLGVRLARAADDLRERARVTKMFRSRVSSNLVDYLTEHPERMNMEGEERELTMCFTDLAGFTSLSEKLGGPRTVRVLNRCLGDLTHEMLERRAYVNKFLGDGIMAFWGAPIEDDRQADHAVESVVACYEVLARINDDFVREGLPPLGLRAGIATGRVIVGDCGAPPKLNDYTVIGDSVNLSARLESANKLLGTHAMVNGTTYERLSEETRSNVLWRHLGCLRVVGQTADIPIHEIVVPRPGEDVDALGSWIKRTHDAVEAYRGGRYEASRDLWDALRNEARGGAGATLYRDACAAILSGEQDACEALVLTSK